MGYVFFRLNRGASLAGMAPAALPGGDFGKAALPPGMAGAAGMYIVINCQADQHNRYVGISSNIGQRFAGRMAAVTELGFPTATMEQIHVVWGSVKVRDEGAPQMTITVKNAKPPPMFVHFPLWWDADWREATPGNGGAFTAMVDGKQINLEHLLIRFVMARMGAGGTVSNNQLMSSFHHPVSGGQGGSPIRVKFHSAAFGDYPEYIRADILEPGSVW